MSESPEALPLPTTLSSRGQGPHSRGRKQAGIGSEAATADVVGPGQMCYRTS